MCTPCADTVVGSHLACLPIPNIIMYACILFCFFFSFCGISWSETLYCMRYLILCFRNKRRCTSFLLTKDEYNKTLIQRECEIMKTRCFTMLLHWKLPNNSTLSEWVNWIEMINRLIPKLIGEVFDLFSTSYRTTERNNRSARANSKRYGISFKCFRYKFSVNTWVKHSIWYMCLDIFVTTQNNINQTLSPLSIRFSSFSYLTNSPRTKLLFILRLHNLTQ